MYFKNISGIFLLLLIGILSFEAVAKSDDWPEFSVPKESRLTVVSENMKFNGVDMRSWELNSHKGPEYILKHYRKAWTKPSKSSAKGAPGYIENELDGWVILSRVEGDYLLTVQVDNKNKKKGNALLGISNLPGHEGKIVLGKGFPMPGGSKVINDIYSTDIGKKSRLLVIQSSQPLMKNYNFYRRKYLSKGWIELSKPNEKKNNMIALVLVKGTDELNITFEKKSGNTNIIAVMVKTS